MVISRYHRVNYFSKGIVNCESQEDFKYAGRQTVQKRKGGLEMKVKCSQCQAIHEVDENQIGLEAQCSCGYVFTIQQSFRFCGNPSLLSWPISTVIGCLLCLIGLVAFFSSFKIMFFVFFVPFLISLYKKYSTTYEIVDEKITIRTGIIICSNSITINKKHVKSVKTRTGILDALFGLSEVAINVAGDKDDVVLFGIKKNLAKQIVDKFSD